VKERGKKKKTSNTYKSTMAFVPHGPWTGITFKL